MRNSLRWCNAFFVKNSHIIAPRQAPMVRALALGLLDEEAAKIVAADLNRSAVERGYTVGTGFLSTPYVLGVLTKYGYLDTAYKMLENTKAPGWLAMVEAGATTVWETYVLYDENGHPLGHSMNHYSPGAVCAFLYDTVCGIRVEGERQFTIAPQPGGTLTHASAQWTSPYGEIKSSWRKSNDAVIVLVFRQTVPQRSKLTAEQRPFQRENMSMSACTGSGRSLPSAILSAFQGQRPVLSALEILRIPRGKWSLFPRFLSLNQICFSCFHYATKMPESTAFSGIFAVLFNILFRLQMTLKPVTGRCAFGCLTFRPSMSQRYCCGVISFAFRSLRGH